MVEDQRGIKQQDIFSFLSPHFLSFVSDSVSLKPPPIPVLLTYSAVRNAIISSHFLTLFLFISFFFLIPFPLYFSLHPFLHLFLLFFLLLFFFFIIFTSFISFFQMLYLLVFSFGNFFCLSSICCK